MTLGRPSRFDGELGQAELQITGRLLQASNATFLAELQADGEPIECVYKPLEGERPLWDFRTAPSASGRWPRTRCPGSAASTACRSRCLPTVRSGPGLFRSGSTSTRRPPTSSSILFRARPYPTMAGLRPVEGLDANDRPVSVIHADVADLRLLAVFDVLINNADRKGGHILSSAGRVFGVDHGVSFHTDHKLRTLLWGWAGAS